MSDLMLRDVKVPSKTLCLEDEKVSVGTLGYPSLLGFQWFVALSLCLVDL